MSSARVVIVDNTQFFLRRKDEATQAILDQIGQKAVQYAQEYVPHPGHSKGYARGDLQRSIGYDRVEKSVRIYATMPYAAYVEVGTSRQEAQPYLLPAVMDHTEEYKSIGEAIYRGDGSSPNRVVRYFDSEI